MTDDDVVEEPALANSNNTPNLPPATTTAVSASTKKKPGPKKGTKRKSTAPGDPASSSSKAPIVIDTPKPSKAIVVEKNDVQAENTLGRLPGLIMEKLDILEKEAAFADFSEKKNFPTQLKPLFADAVSVAMDLQLLNSTFWEHIVKILPYNAFTMKVFIFGLLLETCVQVGLSGQDGAFQTRIDTSL